MTRLNGWLVVFNSRDLENEVFLPSTDFDLAGRTQISVFFEHGMSAEIGPRRVGHASISRKATGLWVSAQKTPELPDAVWQVFVQLADERLLAWSSGSASHLVEKKAVNGVTEILRWPLVDCSLTLTPCEPGAMVTTGEYLEPGSLPYRAQKLFERYVAHLKRVNEFRLAELQ